MSLGENLINLFHVEGQVRGLRSRLDSAERYVIAQTGLLDTLGEQREELSARRRQVQATIGNLEMESAAATERIEKLRNELNGSTTNKQYTAVLTELNTAKLGQTEIDDRILNDMELVEQNTEQLEALNHNIEERQKVKAAAESELATRHEEVGSRLAEVEAEREGAAAAVPSMELKIFNELADAYEGEAMAQIEEIDLRRREYVCGSCNISLPFESVASLLGSSDLMVRCTACGRILYLNEETRGSLVKK